MASRLPRSVVPKKYRLTLEPDLNSFTFKGWCEIDLDVHENTHTLTFHALDLSLDVVKLYSTQDGNSAEKGIEAVEKDETTAVVTVRAAEQLHAHTHAMLRFEYRGNLNDALVGFYRSKYTVDNQDRYMATTQFEPCDARRCFPCWDEPSFKAVFEINVIAPAGRIAISNMQVKWVDQEGHRAIYHFADTPIMSTYLVFVCVGEYDFLETSSKEGVLIRVYTTPGKQAQGSVALEAASSCLSMLQAWFGIPYPLPKLDLIAIPDFSAGAMENWGAVTFRETALLCVPGKSSEAFVHNICRTIAHELAHQWFGNLVTMDWWTHLWLNEGFARWAETLCVDAVHPEWCFWQNFVGGAYVQALAMDSLRSSHAIEVDVQSEKEINEIFDSISYAKGASVIRMLAGFLGLEAFRNGLSHYLTTHQYKNTVTEDLWRALKTATMAEADIETMMSTWTKQVGYPLITVTEVAPHPHALDAHSPKPTRTFRLDQTRFLRSGLTEGDASLWIIPLAVATQGNPTDPMKVVMVGRSMEVSVEARPDEWVCFNSGQTGLYRVRYDSHMLQALTRAVSTKELPRAERLGLENDVYALVQAGLSQTSQLIQLLAYYKDETDPVVWINILTHISAIAEIFSGAPWEAELKRHMCGILAPLAARLTWDATAHDQPHEATLRAQVIGLLGNLGHAETVAEGTKRFYADKLQPDLRGALYSMVVAGGSQIQWNAMLERYESATDPEERRRALAALGRAKGDNLVQATLSLALGPKVRAQDIAILVNSVAASSHESREKVWQWAQENWSIIDSRFSSSLFVFANLVTACTTHFTDRRKADEIEAFFAKHPCPSATRNIALALERVRSAATLRARDLSDVANWVASQAPPAKPAQPAPKTATATMATATTPTTALTPTPAPAPAKESQVFVKGESTPELRGVGIESPAFIVGALSTLTIGLIAWWRSAH